MYFRKTIIVIMSKIQVLGINKSFTNTKLQVKVLRLIMKKFNGLIDYRDFIPIIQ